MILVDTSVWIDHLRAEESELRRLLEAVAILCNPLVIAETALGNLRNRESVLAALRGLPVALPAPQSAVLSFIASNGLAGTGIGYVDVNLLISTSLTPQTLLWTRDRRLKQVAARLNLLYPG